MSVVRDLDSVARQCGLELDDEERDAVLAAAASMVGAAAHEAAADVPHVAASTVGPAPANPRDPYGAVVRWCDAGALGDGPLTGLQVSVKDSIAVGGVPMSAGIPELTSHVPRADSDVVRRLRRAGATIVAVTNMDTLGMAASGETSGFGVTRNPHDATRTAGGSSSGAAAGLFLPDIDLALGTDQGGSVRVPASWCGALGLKPTHGVVPYRGNAGIHPVLDHVGPLARSVTVLRSAFDVLSDHPAFPVPGADRRDRLRVGVLTQGIVGVTSAVLDILDDTAARFVRLGAVIREVSVPEHLRAEPPSARINAIGIATLLGRTGPSPDAEQDFTHALRSLVGARPAVLSPQVKAAWIAGTALRRAGTTAQGRLGVARRRLRSAYDRVLADVDVLLLPTTPFPAFRIGTDRSTAGLLDRGWSMLSHTEPFNLSGHPAITLPVATLPADGADLPIGMMLVGRRYEEGLLLDAASAFETAYGWAGPGRRR